MDSSLSPRRRLLEICREFDLLLVYLFGSRADDGLAVLEGGTVPAAESDLDVGVVFRSHEVPVMQLGPLQVELDELFEPLHVDLVPLQRVDALFQFGAMDGGHRVASTDPDEAARYEIRIMRRAAELLPIQRRIEEEIFGVSTT